MTDFDFSAITRLAADLGEIPKLARTPLRQAVEVTARRVKDGWNGKLYTEGHAARTGASISYDLSKFDGFGVSVIEAEIGAVRGQGRQAGIVRLLEHGSAHNPPHGYGAAALAEQEADFVRGIDLAVQTVEKAARL